MTVTSSTPNLPALATHQRQEVGRLLQASLVELIDLSLIGKQFHWSVVGPLFRPLHEQLDEFIDSWRDLADTIAERAVAIGFWPDGQSATVASATPLTTVEPGALEDQVVVRQLTGRLAEVAERTRDRMDRLGELDAASQDAVIEVVRAVEQQLWMIRVQSGQAGSSRTRKAPRGAPSSSVAVRSAL